jgi:hypothetical protein
MLRDITKYFAVITNASRHHKYFAVITNASRHHKYFAVILSEAKNLSIFLLKCHPERSISQPYREMRSRRICFLSAVP